MFDRWKRYAIISAVILMASSPYARAQSREQKVRADRTKFELDDFWIYNNLPKAFQQAKVSGKPILAVFRCIPCEECVKLDDDVVESNPQLQQLLKQFVRVRVISNNGLDLSTFQFDTDQSFAVMMLRSDGTIYGRYGTRSDRTKWEEDVSVEGLAEALRGVLELHADFPKHEAALLAKRASHLHSQRLRSFRAFVTDINRSLPRSEILQTVVSTVIKWAMPFGTSTFSASLRFRPKFFFPILIQKRSA